MDRDPPVAKASSPDISVVADEQIVSPVRISILHLMSWMTASAIVLAVDLRRMPGLNVDSWSTFVTTVFLVVRSMWLGIPLASIVLLFQYGFRKPSPFPRLPGHWLLLAIGLPAAFNLGTSFAFPVKPNGVMMESMVAFWAVATLLVAMMLAVAGISIDRWSWRGFFFVGAIAEFMVAILLMNVLSRPGYEGLHFWQHLIFARQVIEFLGTPVAVVLYLFDRGPMRRDLLDRLGIFILVIKTIFGIAASYWFYLR